MEKKVLITGGAGFIGFHLIKKFLSNNYFVISIDNLNTYYDQNLKNARLKELGIDYSKLNYKKISSSSVYDNFLFCKIDIVDNQALEEFFKLHEFQVVIHLAAQAGVRYSLTNPEEYTKSNLVGFSNILEMVKKFPTQHFLYASSSSVYGLNKKIPFCEEDRTDQPVSLYAATKKANEIMSYSYSKLYQIPTSGLRFFTVYGPWGRPDMAYYKFAKAIYEDKPIEVYNQGNMKRDFTYIDDIVEGVYKLSFYPPSNLEVPYEIYNIGNNSPVNLLTMIEILEKLIGKTAKKVFLPMQPGDVYETYADVEKLNKAIGYKPSCSLQTGLEKFIDWFNSFHKYD